MIEKPTPEVVFTVPESVRFRKLGEESVLLDLDRGHYFSLDATGTRVWHALIEQPSLAEALAALSEAFEVDAAQLSQDVQELLDELIAAGLLQRAPSTPQRPTP